MDHKHLENMLDKIDQKLSDIQSAVHAIDLAGSETKVRLAEADKRLATAEADLKTLRTDHAHAAGLLKALSVPGFISFIYTAIHLFAK